MKDCPVLKNKTQKLKPHADLECPECGKLCKPQRQLKNGTASYCCTNSKEHVSFRNLRFKSDFIDLVSWT